MKAIWPSSVEFDDCPYCKCVLVTIGEQCICPSCAAAKLRILRDTLHVILDQIDYIEGTCRPNEMIGAVLPKEIILRVKHAIDEEL